MVDQRRTAQIASVGATKARVLLWRYAEHFRATVALKATFRLRDGQTMDPSPAADLVEKDVYRSGDPTQSLIRATEVVPYKPKADLVLVGQAHSKRGKPAEAVAVRFAVFDGKIAHFDKTIHVYGDRSHQGDSPRPFVSMPLIYERAYGGIGHHKNPVGVGGDDRPLQPNLYLPKQADGVACFGPISKYWQERRALIDEKARKKLKQPVQEVIREFDWTYFQTAPGDQRVEKLSGAEWLLLEGLHPEQQCLQTRLPARSARIEVVAGDAEFAPAVLDTVSVDTETMSCHLVWRSSAILHNSQGIHDLMIVAGLGGTEELDRGWGLAKEEALARQLGSPTGLEVVSYGSHTMVSKGDLLTETLIDDGLPGAMRNALAPDSSVGSLAKHAARQLSDEETDAEDDLLATVVVDHDRRWNESSSDPVDTLNAVTSNALGFQQSEQSAANAPPPTSQRNVLSPPLTQASRCAGDPSQPAEVAHRDEPAMAQQGSDGSVPRQGEPNPEFNRLDATVVNEAGMRHDHENVSELSADQEVDLDKTAVSTRNRSGAEPGEPTVD
jgi:hypothetical protein